MITITDQEFYLNKTWDKPIPFNNPEVFKSLQWVELFDQNGYRLTHLEQEYSIANNQLFVLHRDEKSIRKVWMTDNAPATGPHLNHAFLFERKSYSGEALEQLKEFAKTNNLINKLINYKGKWGIDFSMDYVDSFGNSMELLHFEYDSCNLNEVQEIKGIVEEKISVVDWIKASKLMLQRKDEWIDLEFFEQSKWKTDFFGLPSERFKMNAWE
jgi:hypothetical protein